MLINNIFSPFTKEREKANWLLAAIVESSDDAIISKTLDGTVTSWNNSAERIFGYNAAEAIGRNINLIIPPEFQKEESTIIVQVRTGKKMKNHETVRTHKYGKQVPLSITTSPIYNDKGKIIGISQICRDIAERKEAETKLEQMISKLTESNSELERFAYVCSHDLQEPLRMISNFTQRLQKHLGGMLDEKAKHYMEYIINGASNARILISDVLSLARIENETQQYEKVDCNAVLETVLKSLGERISESGARITKNILPEILAHRVYVMQIFQNLIGNALKFCSKEAPIIHIEASEHGNYWQFSVKDNGIGIEPQYQEKIFQIFQRLHTREVYPGTGIGLTIVKKIIEQYGGKIWLESAQEQGTTFFFTLPAIPKNPDPL